MIGNHGTASVPVRTYAADVYTIVNGGFGARLSGEPTGEHRELGAVAQHPGPFVVDVAR